MVFIFWILGSYVWSIIVILYIQSFILIFLMTVNILYIKLIFPGTNKIAFISTMETGYKSCLMELRNFAIVK